MVDMHDLRARSLWVALNLVPGLGETTLRRLYEHFGSVEAVWQASREEICGLKWLRPGVRQALCMGPDQAAVDSALGVLDALGAWVLALDDPLYPELLRRIPDPPPVLYGIGDPGALRRECVAIVGSRRCSTYGIKAARELASGLASRGIGVVSGLAVGVDTAAHKGALEGNGVTVAVKGCGIDIPYPRQNTALAAKIVSSGVVLSEFPPGTGPEPGLFPLRNRIISGLSLGVVVVEASRKSGSLITAACALDQGREVMAVPGSIFSYKSAGTHYLIKMGARLVEGVKDILDEVGLEECAFEDSEEDREGEGGGHRGLLPEEMLVLQRLEAYPQHIDEIAEACGLPVSRLSGLLLQLELKGLVTSSPGQMYHVNM